MAEILIQELLHVVVMTRAAPLLLKVRSEVRNFCL